jgi:hypothetical protein
MSVFPGSKAGNKAVSPTKIRQLMMILVTGGSTLAGVSWHVPAYGAVETVYASVTAKPAVSPQQHAAPRLTQGFNGKAAISTPVDFSVHHVPQLNTSYRQAVEVTTGQPERAIASVATQPAAKLSSTPNSLFSLSNAATVESTINPIEVEGAIAPPSEITPSASHLPSLVANTETVGDVNIDSEQESIAPEALTASPLETYQPRFEFQAATVFLDNELSGRLRATGLYAVSDQVLFGATVDLVGGQAFVDSADEGLSLNELYVSAAPFSDLPTLRFVGGLIDLTSYVDRNSFAKDVVTHFFNPVFQTNPALSAAGINSRPGLLVNWGVTDQVEVKAIAFSSSRELGDLALDGFATEAGFRTGNFIIRGTFATSRDAGDDTSFDEIFQVQRGNGSFGPREDDREVAFGLNAEYFIDAINLGVFGRYGWYENQDIDRSGVTFSFGANLLDVIWDGDRLGVGYGQQLSNRDLRSGKTPDVLEVFYDTPVYSSVRVGVSLQSRDEFSNTGLGFRVRADW